MYERDSFTVGYYDAGIADWYFNGEYENEDAAITCARKTAEAKRTTARVTSLLTGRTTHFPPGSMLG